MSTGICPNAPILVPISERKGAKSKSASLVARPTGFLTNEEDGRQVVTCLPTLLAAFGVVSPEFPPREC